MPTDADLLHELANVMTVVTVNAHWLADKVTAGERGQAARELKDAAARASEIVRMMLRSYRPETAGSQ